MGERLVVQFARGSTRPPREFDGPMQRSAPRPRRTVHRMSLTGLPVETSWQVSYIPVLSYLVAWTIGGVARNLNTDCVQFPQLFP